MASPRRNSSHSPMRSFGLSRSRTCAAIAVFNCWDRLATRDLAPWQTNVHRPAAHRPPPNLPERSLRARLARAWLRLGVERPDALSTV